MLCLTLHRMRIICRKNNQLIRNAKYRTAQKIICVNMQHEYTVESTHCCVCWLSTHTHTIHKCTAGDSKPSNNRCKVHVLVKHIDYFYKKLAYRTGEAVYVRHVRDPYSLKLKMNSHFCIFYDHIFVDAYAVWILIAPSSWGSILGSRHLHPLKPTFELRQRRKLHRGALCAVLGRSLGFSLLPGLPHGLSGKPVHFLRCGDGRHFDAEDFRQANVSPRRN